MIQLNDIHSLTDFLRNSKAHIERLKAAGRPEVLTINGKAELVVQDAASYQALLTRLEQAQAIAGIKEGLASIEAGEGRPAKEALNEIARRLNINEK